MGKSRVPGLADLPRHARGGVEALAAQTGLWADLAHGAPIRAATIKAIGRVIEAKRKRLR